MSPGRSGWQETSLGEICELKYGKSLPESRRAGGDVPVFGSNGIVGHHNEPLTAGPAIIVGRKGSFGEVHFSDRACWPIDTTYYIDKTATKADLRWLAYRIAALGLTGLNRAAAVPGLNREDAYRQRLLLPPLPDQRKIAELLDRAEGLRAKRRAALAQFDTLPEAIFLQMFGDLSANAKHVPIELLGDHLLFVTSGSRGWAKFYATRGSRFIRSLDVQMNRIGNEDIAFVVPPENAEARRTRAAIGDILLTITGSRIGRVAPLPSDLDGSYVSQHVAILRTNHQRIDPTFLSFFLSFESGGQRQIARAQYGQTKPGLNFEQIQRLQIPVPPLSLQRVFAVRVDALEKLKTVHRASLATLDALFASLQYRAFRGEL